MNKITIISIILKRQLDSLLKVKNQLILRGDSIRLIFQIVKETTRSCAHLIKITRQIYIL